VADPVFQRKLVHRAEPYVHRWYAGSTVTAAIASGAIAFGGTATGSTPSVSGGTASGAIVVGAQPIATITALFSAQSPVVLGGTATGRSFVSRTASSAVAFAGTATARNAAASSIVFSGNASAAQGFFTAEVAAPIVWSGSATGYSYFTRTASAEITFGAVATSAQTAAAEITFGGTASGRDDVFSAEAVAGIAFAGTSEAGFTETANFSQIVFAGSLGEPVVDGGLFFGNASGEITFAGTVDYLRNVTGPIVLSGTASGYLIAGTAYQIHLADASWSIDIDE